MGEPSFLNFKDNFNVLLQKEWKLNFTSFEKNEYNQLVSLFNTETDEEGNVDDKLSNTEFQSLYIMAKEAAEEMGDPEILETEEADKLVQKLGINLTGEELITFLSYLKGRICWALAGGPTKTRELKNAEDIKPGNEIPPKEKYNLKNLQKLYPKKNYEIFDVSSPNYKRYFIRNKKTGKPIASYELRNDGTAKIAFYDENRIYPSYTSYYEETEYGVIAEQGLLQENNRWQCKEYPNGDPLSERIVSNLLKSGCGEKQLSNITQFYSSIKEITPHIVINVLDTFKNSSKMSLFRSISSCDTLPLESKKL